MPPEVDVDALQVTHNETMKAGLQEEVAAECLLNARKLRRKKSSSHFSPLSPSSSASQQDGTFEPSIDLLVNDCNLDDETTLKEEEAIAALEPDQDPQDEISKLQEESEMPIEELLARYGGGANAAPVVHANKKSRKDLVENNLEQKKICLSPNARSVGCNSGVIIIESGDEDNAEIIQKEASEPVIEILNDENSYGSVEEMANKKRRSHLLDLYPEESFHNAGAGPQNTNENAEFSEEEEDDGSDSDDEADADSNYGKKTIMVGAAYQAAIPSGLSQYGDIFFLPYENEDKLIWEPSQVSEREVEDYLLKAGEIKPALSENNVLDDAGEKQATKDTNVLSARTKTQQDNVQDNRDMSITSSFDSDSGVVKDNEQALHLLVQCGYDFKEALRRKRLNAVPLTGSMSLWSEDECSKFEEGIQKYGKDFLKIRQNQVRTRTMRELVQFYYLWKKSERRDHNFANSNTVDHMEIYLNESGDYNTNSATTTPASNSLAHNNRKSICCAQNNFSIFTGSVNFTGSSSPGNTADATVTTTTNRRRSTTGSGDNQGGGKNNINSVLTMKQL